jgi:hypothetical protein
LGRDPSGVSDIEIAADEYDIYAATVLNLLESGAEDPADRELSRERFRDPMELPINPSRTKT